MQEAYLNPSAAESRSFLHTRSQSTLIDLAIRFTSLNRPSNKDISIFREQFYTLILNTNGMEKKLLAEKLSRSEYVPKAIIFFLAMEEIAVANYPLLYSPVLKTADLNLILSKCSYEHAKSIARRSDLSTSNVKALMEMDNETGQIKLNLRENLSLKGNSEIVEVLNTPNNSASWIKQRAETVTEKPKPIVKPNITNETKDLSAALLKIANRGGKLGRKPVGKPAKSAFADVTIKQMEMQLLSTARSNDIETFAKSVRQYCGLQPQTTLRFMKNQDAGMLATLLRAMDISDVTAARILLMLNNDIGRNAQIFKVVMDKYSKLDRERCMLFFKEHGADFTHTTYASVGERPATRYSLSLAARERRAALSSQEKLEENNFGTQKLRA